MESSLLEAELTAQQVKICLYYIVFNSTQGENAQK